MVAKREEKYKEVENMMYKMAMGITKKYKKNPKRNESMTSMLSRKSDKIISPAHIPEVNYI